MGLTNSKGERSGALKLCKERKRFMKQAIDSRFALAAAHVSYVQSLRNIGIALRRYAEAEVLVETSTVDKTPSPSPSHVGGGSPLPSSSARTSYMRSSGGSALTIRVSPPVRNVYVEEGEFSMPPPPPPPPESGSSWDYFDPGDESFRFVGQDDLNLGFDDMRMEGDYGKKGDTNGIGEESVMAKSETSMTEHGKRIANDNNPAKPEKAENSAEQRAEGGVKVEVSEKEVNGSTQKYLNSRKTTSVELDICAEKEDASEFITHRAKDFVSSINDIDNRFFRASESGKEVSRMLESSKIRVGYGEARGTRSSPICLASFGVGCCQGRSAYTSDDHPVTKVITWKRTMSSRSSSSRSPLATTKDDNDDSGSDFVEEFCMISGSHSSTLDRLYAWERKLYDEVKASKSIQKEYDRRCDHLRHQFAKDLRPQVIDKTRAVVKDLYSRIGVALHAVDSISKRIEKMRDEELLPQLLELTQGLTRMWKAMLECHHSQYITISLAYHVKNSSIASHGETQRQIISQLQDEVEYFGLSFADWINSYTSYVEALNSWLQNCILLPRERHKGRRAFSPRRYLAPPIFVLCRDWSVGIKSLPSLELRDAIKAFISDLQRSARHQEEELPKNEMQNNEAESKEEDKDSDIRRTQASLTKVLDRLTKFSEASMKMCEDIRQKCDTARNSYENYRPTPRSFSI